MCKTKIQLQDWHECFDLVTGLRIGTGSSLNLWNKNTPNVSINIYVPL